MLQIDIPGQTTITLKHLVLDYNGTIAEDGELINGVSGQLLDLSNSLTIYVITADTHGTVKAKLAGLPVHITVIGEGTQDKQKEEFVKMLGAESVITMGNGRNDIHMLSAAAIGVGLMQKEGCSTAIIQSADILCDNICDALDLLRFPDRIRATLRN